MFLVLSLFDDFDVSTSLLKNLYSRFDATLDLPEELEIKYLDEVEQFEGEKAMAYITSAERIGREQGRQEGRIETQHQIARQM